MLQNKRIQCLALLLFLLMGVARISAGQDSNVYLPIVVNAVDEWAISIGNPSESEQAQAIIGEQDGTFTLFAQTGQLSNDSQDLLALGIDRSGKILWQKQYILPGAQTEFSATKTRDKGYLITALSDSNGNPAAWILRLDAQGGILWQKEIDGAMLDYAASAVESANGDIIVAGYTASFGIGISDLWIVRFSATGTPLWQRTYHAGLYDRAQYIAELQDASLLVLGNIGQGTGMDDTWLLKLDASGNVLWSYLFAGASSTDMVHVADGYLLVGSTTQALGNQDAWVAKTDLAGQLLWQRAYGGSGDDMGTSVRSDGTGLVFSGWTESTPNTTRSGWLVKLDGDGDIVWQRVVSESGYQGIQIVELFPGGGYVTAGNTVPGDLLIQRLDENGWVPSCASFAAGTGVSVATVLTGQALAPIVGTSTAAPTDTAAAPTNVLLDSLLVCPAPYESYPPLRR